MDDSCESCGARNLLETAFATGGLFVIALIGYRTIREIEGYFFLVGLFDFVQIFLLLTSLGLTQSSGGGVYLVTVTSSSLLHPDFLHLDCWLPWISFEHKYMAFLLIITGLVLGAEALWGREKIKSKMLRNFFFKDKKNWDDLKSRSDIGDEESGLLENKKKSDLNPQEDFSESEESNEEESEAERGTKDGWSEGRLERRMARAK